MADETTDQNRGYAASAWLAERTRELEERAQVRSEVREAAASSIDQFRLYGAGEPRQTASRPVRHLRGSSRARAGASVRTGRPRGFRRDRCGLGETGGGGECSPGNRLGTTREILRGTGVQKRTPPVQETESKTDR